MKALLADIGGTNARFALLDGATLGPPLILTVADHATVEDAIEAALAVLAPAGGVERAVLALAGPVVEEPVRLTNASWEVSSRALTARFGFARVRLVNDFLAQAYALPHLGPAELMPLGGGSSVAGGPMVVLGAGTGLGVAGFLPEIGLAIPTEGGHIGLAPTDAREDAVVAGLRRLCGRAGAEEALSGRGIANLHAVLAGLRGAALPARDAAEVVAAAATCPVAAEALDLFLAFLAGTAGDLALAWGARGGVFLSGGILPRIADRLDAATFRARFAAKAPMEDWMADIPLFLVTHSAPAFLGLAALARMTEA
ncbi:glucokinase [Roseomonas sp. AR75]|uniref:glucokinase n=1 Tax=Roseomonas sp. AR75 TaxID=2562311 RepID=UPI0010C0848E|nr:glucokinase [Roseomonas sp. AR75]